MASGSHIETMVDFMERNGDLTRPRTGLQARAACQDKWEELATLLNRDITGVIKSREQWRKFENGCESDKRRDEHKRMKLDLQERQLEFQKRRLEAEQEMETKRLEILTHLVTAVEALKKL